MSVGTATIAACIGAGSYGERIATGLAVNDMLLAGAIPAALFALATQELFESHSNGCCCGAGGRPRRTDRCEH